MEMARNNLTRTQKSAAEYARQRAEKEQYRPKVYDMRINGIPGTAAVIVDDPMERGSKLILTATLRDDPLGRLHVRGQIDDAQLHAGRDMQMFYERAEIGNVKAMDTTKEPVDGGFIPEVLTDAQQRAIKEIVRLERALGLEGSAIIRAFLANRMFIEQIAEQRGLSDQLGRKYMGRRVRECLETLARELHYA